MSDRDEAGRFVAGNRFWEARSSAGPKPRFKNAESLWASCIEYFEWVESNPLYEAKAFAYQGEVTMANLPKMRPMTIGGLCNFLDIEEQTWRLWRAERPDLFAVITRAEAVIRQQKFEGAAAEFFNANIIARDLGLSDKSEITGKDGGPIKTEDTGARDKLAALLARQSAAGSTGGDPGEPDG
jgi:hypothetical protein